jgi:nicotinate-nucleotide pyrophosphorylase (carboxylating)
MSKEFRQAIWDDSLERDCTALVRQAIEEDLGTQGDWTTVALVPAGATGRAEVVARSPGVVAGLAAIPTLVALIDPQLRWTSDAKDGQAVAKGDCVGVIEGPVRGMLAAERILLNFLGRLSGVATLTRRYVDAVAGTAAKIYDTRKTTPGWRKLEKYAVRCGGGTNHRGGLNEAVLIKDNHLAFGKLAADDAQQYTPAEAVLKARRYVAEHGCPTMIVEVEVDTLEQLDNVLPVKPDIVLLDNMKPDRLREAVERRNVVDRAIELEASGGVDLTTVRAIAESGVDRISVGALTHSAVGLDFGLDWAEA